MGDIILFIGRGILYIIGGAVALAVAFVVIPFIFVYLGWLIALVLIVMGVVTGEAVVVIIGIALGVIWVIMLGLARG